MPTGLGGRYFYAASTMGRGYPSDGSSFFEPAPVDSPTIEDRSNLPMQDVMMGKGTDVVGADGKKIGAVEEVVLDEQGQMAGFVVKEGVLFKHRLRVPMEWVENAGEDEIRLNVPSNVVGKEAQLRGV
ncbi:MAG: PRC-barrel domain-containing protein [Thermomicrobiales bacterium]